MLFTLKILVSALLIAGISELAKRNTFVAALTASLPLTSVLAMIWIYYETQDIQKIIDLSYGIFWIVIPSLLFFLALPKLLEAGLKFPWALMGAVALTATTYWLYVIVVRKLGVKI